MENCSDVVLCQDCLAISPYTDKKHMNEEDCKCGGEWCGCGFCQDTAAEIIAENESIQAQAEFIDAAKY